VCYECNQDYKTQLLIRPKFTSYNTHSANIFGHLSDQAKIYTFFFKARRCNRSHSKVILCIVNGYSVHKILSRELWPPFASSQPVRFLLVQHKEYCGEQ